MSQLLSGFSIAAVRHSVSAMQLQAMCDRAAVSHVVFHYLQHLLKELPLRQRLLDIRLRPGPGSVSDVSSMRRQDISSMRQTPALRDLVELKRSPKPPHPPPPSGEHGGDGHPGICTVAWLAQDEQRNEQRSGSRKKNRRSRAATSFTSSVTRRESPPPLFFGPEVSRPLFFNPPTARPPPPDRAAVMSNIRWCTSDVSHMSEEPQTTHKRFNRATR